MIFESDYSSNKTSSNRYVPFNIHGRVFEHDRPFFRVIDPFASVGGVVLVPSAGDGLGEVNDGICGDIERTVRAIAGNGELGAGGETGGHEDGGDEGGVFHGVVVWMLTVEGLREDESRENYGSSKFSTLTSREMASMGAEGAPMLNTLTSRVSSWRRSL